MSHSVLSLIGNTPLVLANSINPNKKVALYLKLEGQNPGGSVKDRAALNMISSGLERGEIIPQTLLIEATSGNTGIALAMIASLFHLKIELVMPENATRERVQTMRAYGAEVTLTPADGGIEGARDYAEAQVKSKGKKMLNQFSNDDNWKAHYKGTGPEIWRDTLGKITHFVSAMGTTGTIMGTGRFLREQNAGIRIIGVQPTDGASIPGIRKWAPEYVPRIFDASKVDQTIEVTEEEASAMAVRLAREEGIFAGMSSGGAAAAAVRLSQSLATGVVVCVVCDRGDRYLSSDLFG